jgi:cyclopropane fatty-acyl-phospholipid synthase-like methyltransferase
MSKQNELFSNYLTAHYGQVTDKRFRSRKKAFIQYNYAQYLPLERNARILEIGPGFGEVLELLTEDLGYTNVKAIDLSKEVVDYCNELVPGSTELVEDSTSFLRSCTDCFDCIIMFHVLEHIPKPAIQPFLTAIHNTLTRDGRLLLEVPNMSNPILGLNIRYADFTHELGFTEMSLKFLMQRTGFQGVHLFESQLPNDRWSRPFQFGLQKLANFSIQLLYRAWAIHPPKLLSPLLCACAVK